MSNHNGHSSNPGYQRKNNWVECQRCGLDYRASSIKREWTGVLVCKRCWEPRHPQEAVRGKKDKVYANIVSPPLGEVTAYNSVGDADITLTWGTDKELQLFETELTANRTVTLSLTDAEVDALFKIQRSETSAYTIDVGGLYTIPASTEALVEVRFNGTAWVLDNAQPY